MVAKTVLLVDDSASLRRVIRRSLQGAGYAVIEAHDGRDALDKLDGQQIHLVISDVSMPNMDGFTLAREMKKLPSYRTTPVVMLTTDSRDSKKKEGRDAGAQAWIVKPFVPSQMINALAYLIQP